MIFLKIHLLEKKTDRKKETYLSTGCTPPNPANPAIVGTAPAEARSLELYPGRPCEWQEFKDLSRHRCELVLKHRIQAFPSSRWTL